MPITAARAKSGDIRKLGISYRGMRVLHWLPRAGLTKLIAHFLPVNEASDFLGILGVSAKKTIEKAVFDELTG